MLDTEKVLAFMRMKGPVLPTQVAKAVDTNLLFASAMLSELSSKSKVKVSSVKVGGSPLYYVPGHESRLQEYAAHLNEKDLKAYERLKEQHVLRDVEQEPLTRVSLRQIKDFAVPLTVQLSGTTEIFWKWYLLPQEEAVVRIKSILTPAAPPVSKPEATHPVEKKEELTKEKEQPTPQQQPKPSQQTLAPKKELPSGPFFDQIKQFCASKSMRIVESTLIRKNMEYDLIVEVSTPVGSLPYFCKVKNKKSVNEGDLSSAFLHAQNKKLPALFLTNGTVTKKAQAMLSSTLKGIHVVHMNNHGNESSRSN